MALPMDPEIDTTSAASAATPPSTPPWIPSPPPQHCSSLHWSFSPLRFPVAVMPNCTYTPILTSLILNDKAGTKILSVCSLALKPYSSSFTATSICCFSSQQIVFSFPFEVKVKSTSFATPSSDPNAFMPSRIGFTSTSNSTAPNSLSSILSPVQVPLLQLSSFVQNLPSSQAPPSGF